MNTALTLSSHILYPLLAQAALTFTVWAFLLYFRLTTIARGKFNPQKLADEAKAQELFQRGTNLSDNFENLFELPILFYVALVLIFITNSSNTIFLILAWGFVFFRALHSLIHCTSNKITLRFAFYLISSLFLWAIWICLGIYSIQKAT